MLVLSRKKNEKIVIGPPDHKHQAVVTVVEIRGDKVRLGVEADKDWPVHRMEVYEAIQRNERQGNEDAQADSGRSIFAPKPAPQTAETSTPDSVPGSSPPQA